MNINLARLIREIRRQTSRGIHTVGKCPSCNKSARDGEVCEYCLEAELAEHVGKELASDFVIATRNVVFTIERMESEYE